MKNKKNRISLAWVAYQRRAESLARYYDLDLYYQHYKWEEKSKYYKPVAYIFKLIQTFSTLFKTRAKIIFLQQPPTFPLYAVAFYCWLTKAIYVADCHNTTFYDSTWSKFPFLKSLLRKAMTVLVHNEDIVDKVKDWGMPILLLRDPIPQINVDENITNIGGIDIKKDRYVIIPGSFATDEPMDEVFKAIRSLPDVIFACTWFKERLPGELQKEVPKNLRLTGFLEEREFNALYANASAAIVLTNREGTQPSGAAEAISLNVPLVVSDIATTRKLYSQAAIFVRSEGDSIAQGVQQALHDQAGIRLRLKDLKEKLSSGNNQQLLLLKEQLDRYSKANS